MELIDNLRRLNLTWTRNHLDEIIARARSEKLDPRQFLELLCQEEVSQRRRNGIRKRIAEAHLPNGMVLSDFEKEHLSDPVKEAIERLSSLQFIEKGENVFLYGSPGAGKTCLAGCLGMEACLKEKSVLFIKAADLLIQLKEAVSQEQIMRYKKKFMGFDLVIIDEMSYLSFSREQSEILFNLISSRSETKSIIVTSNLKLSQWAEMLGDTLLAGALVDRLSHKSHLIDMTGESFRIIETRRWREQNEKK